MMSWLLKIRHILFQLKTSEFDPSPFCIFVNQKFFVIVDEGYDTTADHNSNINVNFHLCPIENASSDVVIDEGQKTAIFTVHIRLLATIIISCLEPLLKQPTIIAHP